jgi:hypothetical protein
VVCLSQAWNGTVQSNQVVTAQFGIFCINVLAWQCALVLTFIIMYEDGRYVDTVGAGHAVFAVVTGNVLKSYDAVSHFLMKIFLFLSAQRY